MTIKGKDFKKAVAFIKDFLQKMPEDADCAQLRDSLNLSLLYMKKYFRTVWLRTQEKNDSNNLSSSFPRGVSHAGPHQDVPDRFSWRWAVVDHSNILRGSLPVDGGKNVARVPLILQAAKEGDRELIEQLIEKEPSCVNDVDEFGRTAAMYAVHFGEQECLEALLQGKTDIGHQAQDGSTALHVAVHDGNYEAVELLLKRQVQVVATIQDSQGRAPVHWATMLPDTQCLELLLKCNINVNVRDRDGLTPAMWACHMDNQRHFELLTSSESNKIAEIDGIERDAVGRTWIHWAVRRSEPLKCLRNLLTAETAAIKDKEGRSVIHISAQLGALEACKAIISHVGSCCLQDVDKHNRTCLHMAALAAHGEVLNYLLEQGADINIRDSSNLTAWDYSCNRNLHYCMMVIRSFHKQLEIKHPMQRQSNLKTPEQEEIEDIEENNNCAILPLENKSITPTPPANDKHGVPSPPNQPKPPKPLFQNIPVPNKTRSPRPLSPKVPLSSPPVESSEESDSQDEQDTDNSTASPQPERQSRVVDDEENSQHMEPDNSPEHRYTTKSGDIIQSAEDGIISSDMQPSHQTLDNEDTPQDEESAIPEGGFENRQRSVSLGSDDISEQSINIGMDVSDIEGEGQSNADSTAEERPVEPLSPKQRTPPHLAKSPTLLPGRSSSPAAVPPRPASPGPAMLYQTGQPQMHNPIQDNHVDDQMATSSPIPTMHQDKRNRLPPPQPVALSSRRLLPLEGVGLESQSNGEDATKGRKGKKKKRRSQSTGGVGGENSLQSISTLKSPAAPLQPVHGGPHSLRPPSPNNKLQPPLMSNRSHSPRSDGSSSPRPPSSRGSSPHLSPSNRSVPTLPQTQNNAWEVSWGPKQPKVSATPITPRDQRVGSPLPSPKALLSQPGHPGEGNGQRLPKEGKEQQHGKKEGPGLQKGVLKPQPLHPQGRPLAPMRPGGQGNFPNQQRPLAPRISQSPRQHSSQSYTQPLNPAPPRGRGRPGGYSL